MRTLSFKQRCEKNYNWQAGFTLVEVLVVVAIISLIIGMATIAIPNSADKVLQQESVRFVTLLSLAKDESIMQSKDIGIGFSETNYRFYLRKGKEWMVLDSELLNEKKLGQSVSSRLLLEDQIVDLKETKSPHVIVSSSGEVTPFEYNLILDESISVSDKGKRKINLVFNAIGKRIKQP